MNRGRRLWDKAVKGGRNVMRSDSLLRLWLIILAMQVVFWGLHAGPWARVGLDQFERTAFTEAAIAELKAPTPAAADAATYRKTNLPFTDCCDPAYLALRMTFNVDQAPPDGLGLVAFQQVDNFIIRLNGSVVHELGAMEFGRQTFHGQRPYLIRLPAGLLKAGENELSFISVRDGYPYTDLVEPLMGPYDALRAATAPRFWQVIDYRMLAGWLTFTLGLLALIMVFRSSERRFAAWLAVLCWSWTAYAAYGLIFDLPFGGVGRMIAFFAINSMVAVALLGFIDAWTRRPVPWGQEAAAAAWLIFNAAGVACLTLMPMPGGFDLMDGAWRVLSLVCSLLVLARLIWHFATVREDRHLEAALLSICALCMALDGVGEYFGLLAGGYLMDSAPLLLLAFVAAFLQRNFTLFQSAMDLNALLETRLTAREAELAAVHARERQLLDRQVRNEERHRLMRDMHDGVGGQLMGLLLAVRRGAVDRTRMAESLQGAMDEIRLMIDSVDAPIASLAVMLDVLETRIAPRIQEAGFQLDWRREVSEDTDLPPQDVLQIFRILQEAVTNALKHSGGDRIAIIMSDATPGVLTLEIVDNGKGMDAMTGDGRGHGLSNMAQRAEALAGQLTFSPDSEGLQVGLRVVLRVPLNPADNAGNRQAA